MIPGIGQARGAPVRSGSASGLGDIVLSATYGAYYDPATTLGLDLTGKMKVPSADESEGLGTGEPDFALLVDLFKTFGQVTGFGGVGFHIMGDAPGLPLENAWSANLGATYKLDARDSVGAMLEGRERVAPGGARTRELTAFWMRRLERAGLRPGRPRRRQPGRRLRPIPRAAVLAIETSGRQRKRAQWRRRPPTRRASSARRAAGR